MEMFDSQFATAVRSVRTIFEIAGTCRSHGIDHACHVVRLTARALECCPQKLTGDAQFEILLAALLHDADDPKFFPKNDDYQNAREVLRAIGLAEASIAPVIHMIGLVSSSKNGDTIPPGVLPPELYPRWADRLAGIGWEGAGRCQEYTNGIGRPHYLSTTLRAEDEADLWGRVATLERYTAYRGKSASMVDHYYDKLLRVGDFQIDNPYLMAEARMRRRVLVEIALEFGRAGCLPGDLRDRIAAGVVEEEQRA